MARDPAERATAAFVGSALARWTPWVTPDGRSPQADFLRAARTHRYRVFRGGNRSGKSDVAVVDSLLRCVGWHPHARKPKDGRPIHGWHVAPDWELHGQVLWPKYERLIPDELVRSYDWMRKAEPRICKGLVFVTGARLDFKSNESGPKKFMGAALDFCGVDEEIDADVVRECRQRLTTRGGDFFAALTPHQRERWVIELERQPMTMVIRASQLDAARAGLAPVDYVESFLQSLPERQRIVHEAGDYAALEGLVYPEFSRATHVAHVRHGALMLGTHVIASWPLPSSWRRRVGVDFGIANPTAVVVVATSPEGDRHVVERVLYAREIRQSLWPRILREKGSDGLALCPPARLVCDHDANARLEFEAAGWGTMPAKKEIHPGLDTVQRALMPTARDGLPGLLVVVTRDGEAPPSHPTVGRVDGHWLAWEMEGYRFPPRAGEHALREARDLPVDKDNHAADALRYVLHTTQPSETGEIQWATGGTRRSRG